MTACLDAQRLAFGRVAELYDRARPSYPPAAADAVIAHAGLSPTARILEVGAGTGKATVLFAERGIGVVAIEPSAAMAARARANCARYPAVEIVESEFESWSGAGSFPALVCAAAWHWLAPEARFHRAREALAPGATLAAMWTFPDWSRCALRSELSRAYGAAAPELAAGFPMHPDSRPERLAGDWRSDVRAADGFVAPVVRRFPWAQEYSGADYVELLATHQDHILLAEDVRAALLAAVAEAVEVSGGVLRMRYVTWLCLARRAT